MFLKNENFNSTEKERRNYVRRLQQLPVIIISILVNVTMTKN